MSTGPKKLSPIHIHIDSVKGRLTNCSPDIAKSLYRLCSYRAHNYQFSEAYMNGVWDGYVRRFSIKTNSFPSGLLFRILNFLKKEKIEYELDDVRKKFEWNVNDVLKNLRGFKYALRPYQIEGVIRGLRVPSMTFWWATSSGKTVQFSALITAMKKKEFRMTLVLVANKDLASQHRDELGEMLEEKIGVIEEGRFEPKTITVAVINTLWNKSVKKKDKLVLKYLESVEHLISDECLHSRALILMPDGSQKTIYQIWKDKDEYVATVTKKGKIVPGRVIRWIRNPIRNKKILKIKVRAFPRPNGTLVCTEDHKIYDKDLNRVLAKDLRVGDWVSFSRRIKEEKEGDYGGKIIGRYTCGPRGNQYFYLTKSLLYENIDLLSDLSGIKKIKVKKFLKKWWPLIPSRMKESRLIFSLHIGLFISSKENVHHKNENKLDDIFKNLELMSHSKHSSLNNNQYSSHNKKKIELSIGMIYSIEECKKSRWTGEYVYDLEIDKYHKYFANCVLVSNCHHIIDSKMFKQTISKCKNTLARHGFSGSPFSLTTDDIELEAITGPSLSKVTMSDLIRGGWVSRPHVHMVKYDAPWLAKSYNYASTYNRKIVKGEERNNLILQIINDEFFNDEKSSILVLIRIISHGMKIKERLIDEGWPDDEFAFIHGGTPQHKRKEVKEMFKNKSLRLVIASQIWNEGIDIPAIDVLIKADGGGGGEIKNQKGIRSVVQQVGRAVRKPIRKGRIDVNTSKENIVKIYDFYDNVSDDLRRHSYNRLMTYIMESEFVIKEARYDSSRS